MKESLRERRGVREEGRLEKEMEQVMFEHILEENKRLKRMLEQVSHPDSTGSWSEVGGEAGTSTATETTVEPCPPPPLPPPPMTPERGPKIKKPRYTPEGTRVPDSPHEGWGTGRAQEYTGSLPWPGQAYRAADCEMHLREHYREDYQRSPPSAIDYQGYGSQEENQGRPAHEGSGRGSVPWRDGGEVSWNPWVWKPTGGEHHRRQSGQQHDYDEGLPGGHAPHPGEYDQRRHLPGDGDPAHPCQSAVTGQRGGGAPGAGSGKVRDDHEPQETVGDPSRGEVRDVPTPAEARAQWLEREVRALQSELERIKIKGGSSSYWERPVEKTGDGRAREAPEGERTTWEERDEALRQVPITLPKLTEPGGKTSMLDAGDWLAQLRPLVSDVSGGALRWWDNLMEQTMTAYRRWLSVGPLEKLHVKAPTLVATSAGHTRLDQRVTMMVMGAIPAGVRQEIVASRELHAAGVIFKLLRTYQPGGLSEKAMVLDAITRTKSAGSALEAADMLRLLAAPGSTGP